MILNAEQSMVQEMMRNYAQNQLKPTAAHRDKTHEFTPQELSVVCTLGHSRMPSHDDHDGADMHYVSVNLANSSNNTPD
ncbi:acyl-CoA dehydrogenase family protein [Acinetobacter baumannii]|nr:acyl-CoA dehydrogenase family protein [Acinetobacter baumannii]